MKGTNCGGIHRRAIGVPPWEGEAPAEPFHPWEGESPAAPFHLGSASLLPSRTSVLSNQCSVIAKGKNPDAGTPLSTVVAILRGPLVVNTSGNAIGSPAQDFALIRRSESSCVTGGRFAAIPDPVGQPENSQAACALPPSHTPCDRPDHQSTDYWAACPVRPLPAGWCRQQPS